MFFTSFTPWNTYTLSYHSDFVYSDLDINEFSFDLEPDEHYAYELPRVKGDPSSGFFNVSDHIGIVDFFICDLDNYSLWLMTNQSDHLFKRQTGEVWGSWDFIIPDEGPWLIVIISMSTITLTVDVTEYKDEAPPRLFLSNIENESAYLSPLYVEITLHSPDFGFGNVSLLVNGRAVIGDVYDDPEQWFVMVTWIFTTSDAEPGTGLLNIVLAASDSIGNYWEFVFIVYLFLELPQNTETSAAPTSPAGGSTVPFPFDPVVAVALIAGAATVGGVCLLKGSDEQVVEEVKGEPSRQPPKKYVGKPRRKKKRGEKK